MLSIQEGELVIVLDDSNDEWFLARTAQRDPPCEGWVPASYVYQLDSSEGVGVCMCLCVCVSVCTRIAPVNLAIKWGPGETLHPTVTSMVSGNYLGKQMLNCPYLV